MSFVTEQVIFCCTIVSYTQKHTHSLSPSTGTPKGVGSVKAGQKIHAGLEVEGQGLVTELLLQVKDREGGYAFQP